MPETLHLDLLNDIVSAVIGTVLAIVIISWWGGAITSWWSERHFEKRWRTYRPIVARDVERRFTGLFDTHLPYFGRYLKEIAGKEEQNITAIDYEIFQLRRAELERSLGEIENIIGSYHFCFREADLLRAEALVESVHKQLDPLFEKTSTLLSNFESMLTKHLQGSYRLSHEVISNTYTRHEFMRDSAISIDNIIRDNQHKDWTAKLLAFTEGLKH